jgi:hypothetical protein
MLNVSIKFHRIGGEALTCPSLLPLIEGAPSAPKKGQGEGHKVHCLSSF